MNLEFRSHIEETIGQKIISERGLGGGDISSVSLVQIEGESIVVKYGKDSGPIFSAEKIGLETIRDTHTIATPEVYFMNTYMDTDFLIMEYVENSVATTNAMKALGKSLAAMHSYAAPENQYGFPSDNFIGSLPQINEWTDDWPEFYSRHRLFYQMHMAQEKGLLQSREVPSIARLKEICNSFLYIERPSLLHGDLWSGNYLISHNDTPHLIDPAIYYGDPMVDIAMSMLFGGFDKDFYSVYFEAIERPLHFDKRIDLYQLYYLLVHLNMFGSSYYGSVMRLIRKYI